MDYDTVFRVQDYKQSLELVWVYMIGFRDDAFWYPAAPFKKATDVDTLKMANEDWSLRFSGVANIYAERIDDLNIHNLSFLPKYSGDEATVTKNLFKDLGL
jgi:hypothetical protein